MKSKKAGGEELTWDTTFSNSDRSSSSALCSSTSKSSSSLPLPDELLRATWLPALRLVAEAKFLATALLAVAAEGPDPESLETALPPLCILVMAPPVVIAVLFFPRFEICYPL